MDILPAGARCAAVTVATNGVTVAGVLSAYAVAPPDLAPYVERIWMWRGRPERLALLLPGTGAELVIQNAGRLVADTPTGARELPVAHLLCLRRQRWQLTADGPVWLTAIRFRAGALGRFTAVPATVVADEVVAAGDVFGPTIDRVVESVVAEPHRGRRFALLWAWLRLLSSRTPPPDPRVEAAVRRVYRDPAAIRVAQLGPAVSLSTRHLRRGFLASVGVSPKEYQRLARFQRVVRGALLGETPDWLLAALSCGYYDQSHFIKEFRRFTGQPPSRLLGRPVSHFYYPRIERSRDDVWHECCFRGHDGATRVRR